MKKGFLLLSVILVAAMIAGFVFNINDGNAKEVEGLVLAYENYKEMVSAIGYVGYENEVVIKSQVGGFVDFFPYSVGDRISDSTIASINNEEVLLLLENDMIALELAQARLVDYETNYDNAYSSIVKQRNVISEEKQGLELSISQLDDQVGKLEILVEEGIASKAELTTLLDQRSQVSQSLITLDARKSSLLLPSYTAEEINASIRGREQLIAIREAELSKYQVSSPIQNGLVIETYVTKGEYISPGQTLMKVVSDQVKYVEVDIDESFLSKVNVGDVGDLLVEGSQEVVKGELVKIAPTVNLENGTVKVTLKILTDLDMFLENMTVQVDFTTFNVEEAIVISGEYLFNSNGDLWVYVWVDDGLVSLRKVGVYNQNFDQVYITEGLTAGDTIIMPNEASELDLVEE